VHQFIKSFTLIIFFLISKNVYADIDLTVSLHCSFQKGQVFTIKEAVNITNSIPLKWTFYGLSTDKPMYVAGADAGEVLVVPIDNGYSIYLPYQIGAHLFSIWKTGESTWSKQSNLAGTVNTQQFLGSCSN
jgi:hypothetical protein